MGSGRTSGSSNAAVLPVAAVLEEDSGEEGYAAERESMRAASRRNSTSLLISNSICLSRGVGDHTHYLLFSNATGELQMRREALFRVLRFWSRCSLHLSVLTGELRIRRKSRAETQVFPLTMYTGASVHHKHRNIFKICFYGHDVLLFRTAEPRDAALWYVSNNGSHPSYNNAMQMEVVNEGFRMLSPELVAFCDDQELMLKRIAIAGIIDREKMSSGPNGEV
ncbi:TKL protein kinase [Phytophthora cinnamomi]|uniref:TKL protein kinase n=1 Tax=Phytophthora cinnamomi TaxID=4785 RepID=UPI00355A7DA3|nr:TKL protein kinase [Phytophthora cinnamomi]